MLIKNMSNKRGDLNYISIAIICVVIIILGIFLFNYLKENNKSNNLQYSNQTLGIFGYFNQSYLNPFGITLSLENATAKDMSSTYSGLFAYWKLDQGNGTFFVNEKGKNNGTCTGTACPTFVNSSVSSGGAYYFDGNDAITGSDVGFPTGAVARTFSVWIKPSDLPESEAIWTIAGYGPNSYNSQFFMDLDGRSDPNLYHKILFTQYGGQTYSISKVNKNEWLNVVMVHEGSEMISIYFNGVLDSYQQLEPGWVTIATTLSSFQIGSNGYKGAIDEVAFFNRSLSASEIANLYNLNKYKYGTYDSQVFKAYIENNSDTQTLSYAPTNANGTIIPGSASCTGSDGYCYYYDGYEAGCSSFPGCYVNPSAGFCDGSVSGCSTYNNDQGACSYYTGCFFNTYTSSCSNNGYGSCSTYNGDYNNCITYNGCTYQNDTGQETCAEDDDCANYGSDGSGCGSLTSPGGGCSFYSGDCMDDMPCYYKYDSGSCYGTTSPSGSCYWMSGCSYAGPITDATTEGDCYNWQPYSSGIWTTGGGYTATSLEHAIQVFAYKNTKCGIVYNETKSQSPIIIDAGDSGGYNINWTWDAVAGATGYKILKNYSGDVWVYDHSLTSTQTSLLDNGTAMWSLGNTVTPTSCSPLVSTTSSFWDLIFSYNCRNLSSGLTNCNANNNVSVKTRTANTYNITDPNLISFWNMNNQDDLKSYYTSDLTSNNFYGTPNGLANTIATGKLGRAGSFDGINSYLNMNNIPALSNTAHYSISAWVYLKGYSTYNTNVLYSKYVDDNNYMHGQIDTNVYSMLANGGNSYGGTTNNPISLNNWYLLTFVFDGDGATDADKSKVYVNTTLQTLTFAGASVPTTTGSNSNPFYIAHRPTNSYFFNGTIDEFQIYNRSLNSSDIAYLYNSGAGRTAVGNENGLVAVYPMEEDNWIPSAKDEKGKNNVTCSGVTCPTWNENVGVVGGGYTFDGSDDELLLPELSSGLPTGATLRTFSAWIKTSTPAVQFVFDMGGSTYQRFYVAVHTLAEGCQGTYSSTGGNYALLAGTAGTGTNVCDNIPINDGQWHHIAVTTDGTNLTLYKDGQFRSTGDPASTINTVLSGTAKIGQLKESAGYGFNGNIDEVRIYNRSLSAVEISDLYKLGATHISDWSAWSDSQTITNNVKTTSLNEGKLMQFRTELKTNDSLPSIYLLNHSVYLYEASGPTDDVYPSFSNEWNNNNSITLGGIALFNITVENTNGSVKLNINGNNYFATNLTSNVYNVSVSGLYNQTYAYTWTAYGNGTNNNANTSTGYYTVAEPYNLLNSFAENSFAISHFVRTNGTSFTLNGLNYTFTGANAYYLADYATNKTFDDARNEINNSRIYVNELLDKAQSLNINVMRTWAMMAGGNTSVNATTWFIDEVGGHYNLFLNGNTSNYNETMFQALDYVLAEASKRDIRIQLVLVNNWDTYGGMSWWVQQTPSASKVGQGTNCYYNNTVAQWFNCPTNSFHDQFFTNPETIQLFQTYVSYVLNRNNTYTGVQYKNDPTIFSWLLANEPRAKGDGSSANSPTNLAKIANWTRNMTTFIKSIDSNHLIGLGLEGLDYNATWGEGTSWILDQNNTGVDFATFELNPEQWNYVASASENATNVAYQNLGPWANSTIDWWTVLNNGTWGYQWRATGGWNPSKNRHQYDNWVLQHTKWAKDMNMPVVIEEVEVVTNISHAVQDRFITQALNTFFNNGGDGLMFWNFNHDQYWYSTTNGSYCESGYTHITGAGCMDDGFSFYYSTDPFLMEKSSSLVSAFRYITGTNPTNTTLVTILNNNKYTFYYDLDLGVDEMKNCSLWINTTYKNNSFTNYYLNQVNQSAIINGTNNFVFQFPTEAIFSHWYIQCCSNISCSNLQERYVSTPPEITTLSPLEGSILNFTNVQFNYTVADGVTVTSCSLLLDGEVNQVDNSISSDETVVQSFNTTISSIPANHAWQITCTDMSGSTRYTAHNNFIYDDRNMSVILTNPINNSIHKLNQNFTANITSSAGIATINLYINNVLSQITTLAEDIFSISIGTVKVLVDGIYTWFYEVFDTFDLSTNSTISTVTIDKTLPSIDIVLPINNAWYNYTNISTLAGITETNLDSCWYLKDASLTKIPIVCNSENYINWSQGNHNITHFANDTAGNSALSIVTINIDTSKPNAVLNTPMNNTYTNSISQNLTVNITDNLGIANASLFINGILNKTVNFTSNTITSKLGIITNFEDGAYTWLYQIFDFAGNSYTTENNTLTIDTVISVLFNYQSPADLNLVNFLGSNGINIYYNISDSTGINLSSVKLYEKSNSSNSDVSYYINGTTYSGYNAFNYSSYVSEVFRWRLFDNDVLPASYNYDEKLMENTTHDIKVSLPSSSSLLSIEILNISDSKYGFFEVMMNRSTGSLGSTIYFCNSSYTSGGLSISNGCTQIYQLNNNTFDHRHSVNSAHMVIPFTVDNTTGKIGEIKVTSNGKFIIRGAPILANWDVYGISNLSREGAFKTSSNTGNTWTNQNYTIDAHLHQFSDNNSIWYYACASDILGNINCTNPRQDLLILGNLPPTSPNVYLPINGKYSKKISINYTEAVSPNDYKILIYNISLINTDGTFNKTIINNNSNNLGYIWNSSSTSEGSYFIKVQAYDSLDQSSIGYSDNFTIDNTSPLINLTSPTDGQTVTGTSIDFKFSVSDLSNVTNCSLYYNSGKYRDIFSIYNSENIISIVGISGNHPLNREDLTWNISCTDELNNIGNSVQRSIIVKKASSDDLVSSQNNPKNPDHIDLTYQQEWATGSTQQITMNIYDKNNELYTPSNISIEKINGISLINVETRTDKSTIVTLKLDSTIDLGMKNMTIFVNDERQLTSLAIFKIVPAEQATETNNYAYLIKMLFIGLGILAGLLILVVIIVLVAKEK